MDHDESAAEYRRHECVSTGTAGGPGRDAGEDTHDGRVGGAGEDPEHGPDRDPGHHAGNGRDGDAPRGRPVVPVPWFATPVPVRTGKTALRPVREDEIEELDDMGPWELRPARLRPAELRSRDPSDGTQLVSYVVGRALKAHRWSLRLTQAQYARRTGRGQGTVSRLECGRTSLGVVDLIDTAFETGRSIVVQVLPDNTRTHDLGPVHHLHLGTNGSVRVCVGPAPAVPPPMPG